MCVCVRAQMKPSPSQQGGEAKQVRHKKSKQLRPVCPKFIAKANPTPANKLAVVTYQDAVFILGTLLAACLLLAQHPSFQLQEVSYYTTSRDHEQLILASSATSLNQSASSLKIRSKFVRLHKLPKLF